MSGRLSYVSLSIKEKPSLIFGLSARLFHLFTQATGILMFVPFSVFDDHYVAIQANFPSQM